MTNKNQPNTLIIETPYKTIEISNTKIARYYLKNLCSGCPRSTLMNSCSYAQSKRCEINKSKIAQYIIENDA